MSFLKSFHQNILLPLQDSIYPPVCFTCGEFRENRRSRICPQCWMTTCRVDSENPTWVEIKNKLEMEEAVQAMLSCFLFEKEGKVQEIIHLLKYSAIKSVGVELGEEIGRAIVHDPVFSGADVLIPVPLHKLKFRERGYNQSELLCKGISVVTHIPMNSKLLVRNKYTLSQTQLSLDERKANVGDAFAAGWTSLSDVENKTIIIVDDVITTGSTISACARVLRAGGARCVLAASAALAR